MEERQAYSKKACAERLRELPPTTRKLLFHLIHVIIIIISIERQSSNNYWIEWLGLFENDRNVLLSSQWLNDNIIYVAQQLMKLSIPVDTTIGGLQSP